MAQNITLLGAQYPDVPAVDLPKTGGGTARFTDVSDTDATAADVKRGKLFHGSDGQLITGVKDYHFLGDNLETVKAKFYEKGYTLDETVYATWTPSTTAQAIVASETLTDKKFTADMLNYEYIIEWLWDAEIAYPTGQTMKTLVLRQFGVMYQIIHRRPNGFANFAAMNANYNYCTTEYSASSYCDYYNSSGSHTWTSGISYGFYGGATAAALSSTTANSPTVTPKTPVINARCSTTYFSTTRAGQVDQQNSTVKIQGNLYRVDIATNDLRNFYMRALEMYNNPL